MEPLTFTNAYLNRQQKRRDLAAVLYKQLARGGGGCGEEGGGLVVGVIGVSKCFMAFLKGQGKDVAAAPQCANLSGLAVRRHLWLAANSASTSRPGPGEKKGPHLVKLTLLGVEWRGLNIRLVSPECVSCQPAEMKGEEAKSIIIIL